MARGKQDREIFARAKKAVNEVRQNMSVSWQQTLEELDELREMCDSSIEALREEHRGD